MRRVETWGPSNKSAASPSAAAAWAAIWRWRPRPGKPWQTVRAAVEAGINLIDTAPMASNCEQVIREAFAAARLRPASRFTTKCQLGGPPAKEAAARLEASLDASLAAMDLNHVDVFFLHSNIRPDDYVYARHDANKDRFSTPWRTYVQGVAPAMERLKASGRIGAWGITGIGVPTAIREAISHDLPPDIVQAVANLPETAPAACCCFAEPAVPREGLSPPRKRAGWG